MQQFMSVRRAYYAILKGFLWVSLGLVQTDMVVIGQWHTGSDGMTTEFFKLKSDFFPEAVYFWWMFVDR